MSVNAKCKNRELHEDLKGNSIRSAFLTESKWPVMVRLMTRPSQTKIDQDLNLGAGSLIIIDNAARKGRLFFTRRRAPATKGLCHDKACKRWTAGEVSHHVLPQHRPRRGG